MNRDLIIKVANAIEKESIKGLKFDMDSFGRIHPSCGTVACIAGYAVAIKDGVESVTKPGIDPESIAEKYLDLSRVEAYSLFYGGDLYISEITPTMAVTTLRHLAKTGEVDWDLN